ncbi:benenodin family lasso peptide [Sphingobium sp. LB126]|nr:benenodin family lasso peptide [Sphingobium sp. LB126]
MDKANVVVEELDDAELIDLGTASELTQGEPFGHAESQNASQA